MYKRRSRSASSLSPRLENLEGRVVMSVTTTAIPQGTVEVAAQSGKKAATQTTLAVSPATLGQSITFNVTVKANASAGSPSGTVNLIEKGKLIQTLTLSPTTSTSAKSASSSATYTLPQAAGGASAFFGKYPVTAQFVPSGSFQKSTTAKTVVVSPPNYTTLADGVKIATVTPGSGAAIQSGQTASVMYTGYLAKNGKIFDDSINDGGSPFSFTVGGGQVIKGFDEGTTGMQVGETRIVEIPAAEGYGSESSSAIPANSTLIFVLTLESIS